LIEETYFRDGFIAEREKVLIDNINLLYVAFTRAEDNLYIIAQPKKKNDNYELLKELAVPLLQVEKEREGEFTQGKPDRKADREAGEKTADLDCRESDKLISNKWYAKISIRRKSADFWKFDGSYREEKRSWGILIHQVLSNIRTLEDVPRVVEKTLISGDIEEKEKEILKNKIAEIFEIEAAAEWFKPGHKVFIEAPVITGTGILRPDRVILSGEKVIVIDFKTGEKSSSHVNQVIKYKNALRDMGYRQIDAILFYLKDKEIIKVAEGGMNGIPAKDSR
jgi:ATP-dependent exoDNAse (exonuclease V) beta subunit